MVKQNKKGRGRPTLGGKPSKSGRSPFIGLRFAPDQLEAIDAWAKGAGIDSRSAAIRALVVKALKVSPPKRKTTKRKPRVPQPMVLKMPGIQTD